MSIIRHLMWAAFKRAAADPRVQKKAVTTAVKVDQKLTETADKVVEIAVEKDPMREAGRMVGKLMSGGNDRN
ncbi:MAG: hypothetical protein CMM31_09345 [Rhodospirillaceae bacterium]|nr:hypothetical protein [Rhodospirillaceae bacterium]